MLAAAHVNAVEKHGVNFIEGIEGREGILENGLNASPVFLFLSVGGNVPGLALEQNLPSV